MVTARFLKRAGHQPQILEAGTSFGGVWADNPTNDVVYKDLQTNLPTLVMQSPDLDFPSGLPSYIDKPTLGKYVESYASAFDVATDATFGAKVTRVTQTSGDANGDEAWKVEWDVGGVTHAGVFDAVRRRARHPCRASAAHCPRAPQMRRALLLCSPRAPPSAGRRRQRPLRGAVRASDPGAGAVSYTHLTLPTICSV